MVNPYAECKFFEGKIFTDGSGMWPRWRVLATGGLGVIQMDHNCRLVRCVAMAASIISGQTAVAMEMAAPMVALHFYAGLRGSRSGL